MFLDSFQQEFRYAGTKPHVLFAGRMEGDLMAGCGQKTTSSSGFTIKVGSSLRRFVKALTQPCRHDGSC